MNKQGDDEHCIKYKKDYCLTAIHKKEKNIKSDAKRSRTTSHMAVVTSIKLRKNV